MVVNSQPEYPPSLGVDNQLTDRALRALLKHHESSASSGENTKLQLLENDLDVQVQFSLAQIPGNASPKPIRIEIPHPLVKVAASSSDANDAGYENLRDVEACIIVKEESKPWVQDMIARFPKELGCIKKVLGLQSLRVKHKTFAQRRELLARFDIFFADDRILPMLTKALGGKFFEKKKQPIAVKLTRKEALPFAIQKSLSATFMFLSAGTCVTVKAGNTSMSPSRLLANIQAICTIVPTKVPKKWSNIRSISIKTTNSVALPVYNKTPEELEQIRMLAREDKHDVVEVKEVEDKDADENDKSKSKGKGKNIASTPLAKALKKQQVMKDNDDGAAVEKSTKTSKKKRKDALDDDEEEVDKLMMVEGIVKSTYTSKKQKNESIDQKDEKKASISKTPKSSKKKADEDKLEVVKELVAEKKAPKSSSKKRKDASESTNQEAVREKETVPNSAKKSKTISSLSPSTNENVNFIASKAFVGAKNGYVFRKSKLGLGYYKDVLPAVDKVWLSSLGKTGGDTGGRGSGRKSMGHSMRSKKGGNKSRKSY